MKKLFVIAAALVTLAACNKNNPVEIPNLAGDNAIGFSAYTASPVTKGTVADTPENIGVFAFYQPAVGGAASNFSSKKYATPDFMYNQSVKVADGTYAPVKYWPNNANDQLSFFAYAPYKDGMTWEDMGIETDINATKMTVSFPVYDSVADQVDYLWSDPVLNQAKPAVDKKIEFKFNHIMSQINLFVAAETDMAEDKPIAWTDATTTITVEKVEFAGLAESLDFEYTIPISGETAPTATGSQDIVLTAADFDNDNKTSAAWNDNKFYQLNKAASTMFVAPQALGDVVITYTVATVDTANAANNSTITNVITADMSALTLAAGKSYKLNFLIGMTSVKITADVVDWIDGSEEQLDVPANTAA